MEVDGQRHALVSLFPRKIPVQEAGWVPGPVWTVAKNLVTTVSQSSDRAGNSELLYWLSYPGPY